MDKIYSQLVQARKLVGRPLTIRQLTKSQHYSSAFQLLHYLGLSMHAVVLIGHLAWTLTQYAFIGGQIC